MEDREIFGKNLQKYVAQSGKQQKDIAFDLHVSATTFNNWCMGVSMPRKLSQIRQIAAYFNVLVSALTDETPEESMLTMALSPDEYDVLVAYRALVENEKDMIRAALRLPRLNR